MDIDNTISPVIFIIQYRYYDSKTVIVFQVYFKVESIIDIPKLILLSSISCHATIINRPEMGGGVSLMALGSLEISNNLAFEINEMMSKMTSDEIANEICKLYDLNPKQWEDIIAECRRRNFISLQQQDSNGGKTLKF